MSKSLRKAIMKRSKFKKSSIKKKALKIILMTSTNVTIT